MTNRLRWAVVVFPGSNCDQDCVHALRDVMKQDVIEVWHKDGVPGDVDCIVLPGGFSYGDYLRTGALAALSPVMRSVKDHAARGTLVLGICNGFQVLCEAGLLSGVLMKNRGMRFRCHWQHLRVARTDTPFTSGLQVGQVIRLPIAHGFGNFWAPKESENDAAKLAVLQYCDEKGRVNEDTNPNGSFHGIAGICNASGNILGLMPHPERACEAILGGENGRLLFESVIRSEMVART